MRFSEKYFCPHRDFLSYPTVAYQESFWLFITTHWDSYQPSFDIQFSQRSSYSWTDIIIETQPSLAKEESFSDAVYIKLLFKREDPDYPCLPTGSQDDEMVIMALDKIPQMNNSKVIKFLTEFNTFRSEAFKDRYFVSLQPLFLKWKTKVELSKHNQDYIIQLPGNPEQLIVRRVPLESLSSHDPGFNVDTINVMWVSGKYNKFRNFLCLKSPPRGSFPWNISLTLLDVDVLFEFPESSILDKYSLTFTSYKCSKNYFNLTKHHYIVFDFDFFSIDICNPDPKGLKKISWIEADKLCRHVGGTLPQIRSRDELDELRSLLKFGKVLPPIGLLFIGFNVSEFSFSLAVWNLETVLKYFKDLKLCFRVQ